MDTTGNKRTPRPSQTTSSLSPNSMEVDPSTIAALDKMISQMNDNDENLVATETVPSSASTSKNNPQRSLHTSRKSIPSQRPSVTKPDLDAAAVAELSNFKMTTVEDDPFDILITKQQHHHPRQSSSSSSSSSSILQQPPLLSSSLSFSSSVPSGTLTHTPMDTYPTADDLGEEIRQRYLSSSTKSSSSPSPTDTGPSSSSFTWEGVKIGGSTTEEATTIDGSLSNDTTDNAIPTSSSRIPTLSKASSSSITAKTSKPLPSKSAVATSSSFGTLSGGGKNLLDQLKLKDAEIDRLEAIILAMSPSDDSTHPGGLSAQRLLNVGNNNHSSSSSAMKGSAKTNTDDPRDAKIMELAKKNRALNLALNKEKDKAFKLSTELQVYQTHQSGSSLSINRPTASATNDDTLHDAETLAVHSSFHNATSSSNTSNLKSLQNALAKAQRTAERATLELKATHRILQKEIGNDVPLNKILAAHGIVNSIVFGDLSALTNISQTNLPNTHNGNGYMDAQSVVPLSPPMSAGGETVTSRSQLPSHQPNIVSSNHSVISGSASATGHILAESTKGNLSSNNAKFLPGEWRGRQQIITLLRTRIKTLERELVKYATNQGNQNSSNPNPQSSASLPLSMSSIPEHDNVNYSSSTYTPNKQSSSSHSMTPSVQLLINSETGAPADEAFGLGLDADEDNAIQSLLPPHHPSSVISNKSSPQGLASSSVSQLPPAHPTTVSSSSSISQQVPPSFDVDDRAAAMLTARDNTKAMQIARLNEQLSGAKTDVERARMEAAAAKARNTILETELKKFKNHVKSLLTKTESDDKLIESLRTELKTLKQTLTDCQKKLATAQLNTLPGDEGTSGRTLSVSSASHGGGGGGNDKQTIMALKQQIASLREELELLHSVNNNNNQSHHYPMNHHPSSRVPENSSSSLSSSIPYPPSSSVDFLPGTTNNPPPPNGNNSPVRNTNTLPKYTTNSVPYGTMINPSVNNPNTTNNKLPVSKPKYTGHSALPPPTTGGTVPNFTNYSNNNTNNDGYYPNNQLSVHQPPYMESSVSYGYEDNNLPSSHYSSQGFTTSESYHPPADNHSSAHPYSMNNGNTPFVGSPGFRVLEKGTNNGNYVPQPQSSSNYPSSMHPRR